MIRYIVLWKLDLNYSQQEKYAIRKQMADKLLSLKKEMKVLQSISVFFNSEGAVKSIYDVMPDSIFE